MDKARLKELLNLKPLKLWGPNSPETINKLITRTNELHELTAALAQMLTVQGAAIIRHGQEIVEIKGDLLLHEVPREDTKPAIIMPPKLELN